MKIFTPDQPFVFGKRHFQQGGYFGPINSSYLDLVIVYKGDVTATVDGVKRSLIPGHVSLIFNKRSASYTFHGHTHHAWCETGKLMVPQNTLEKIISLPLSLPLWDRIDNLMNLGVELGESKDENHNVLVSSLGTAVFNDYFYQANFLEEKEPLPDNIMLAKRFIEENYHEHCDLDAIASNVDLTQTYLVSSFKKHLGITPSRYLWMYRAEKAIDRLTQTDLSINEIAISCGFQNQFHFSRYIKKHFGYPPTQLRKRKWQRLPSVIKENPIEIKY